MSFIIDGDTGWAIFQKEKAADFLSSATESVGKFGSYLQEGLRSGAFVLIVNRKGDFFVGTAEEVIQYSWDNPIL